MKNNKGFSLVELIIVVAIMAVLMGVLAPQYLRYVEKTKIRTDDGIVSDIDDSIEAMLSESMKLVTFGEDNATSFTVNVDGSIANDEADGAFITELYATVYGSASAPSDSPFESTAYSNATDPVATITYTYDPTYATFASTIVVNATGSAYATN